MPNLCVAHQVCTDYIDVNDLKIICSKCGLREFIFTEDLVKQLLSLCIWEGMEFSEIVYIAHNAKAFDAQFILKELAENSDSINYFQMKLSALPTTFGLSKSSKKGYFLNFFNTFENQRYVGALPSTEFYGPDTMAPAERAAFLDWCENTSPGYIFDFQKEIVKYCQMDVEIQRRACIQFRKVFLEVGETDPFIKACTIASACFS